MEPYLLILLSLLALTIVRGFKGRNTLALIVLAAMMILCGLRGKDVGVDTMTYWEAFKRGSIRMEPTFQFIVYLCHTLDLSFKGFLMSYAVLTFIPFGIFIKKLSKDVCFSVLIFLSFSVYFYHETFNTIRVCAAAMYVLLALMEIENEHKMKGLLFLVLGFFFHYSSLVVIPFILILYFIKHVNFITVSILLLLSFILGLSFTIGFSDYAAGLSFWIQMYGEGDLALYYQTHLDTIQETSFNIVGTLAFMLPFSLFALFMYDDLNARSLYYKLFCVAAIIENLFISIALSYRLSLFFLLLITVLLPNTYMRTKGLQKFALLGLSSFMVLWYLYQLFRANTGSLAGTIPYHF